jgi:hypothetical protein
VARLENVRSCCNAGTVIIAGRYRSGKSLLMGELTGRVGEFSVGHTIQGHTQGIWISRSVLKGTSPDGKPLPVLMLDSEGLGDTSKDEQYDTRIFALATLLCSTLVFNGGATIDESSIQSLGFISNLSRAVRVRSSSSSSADGVDLDEFQRFLPSFVWVLRDFALRMVDEDGMPITEDEYMESALQDREGYDPDTLSCNATRQALRGYFRNRRCVALVRPVDNEEQLQALGALVTTESGRSALRPQFREGVERLRDILLNPANPKTVGGGSKLVTGPLLLTMAETYCSAINSGGVPVIADAWTAAAQKQSRRAAMEGWTAFRTHMDERVLLPMDENDLDLAVSEAQSAGEARFRAVAPSNDSKEPAVEAELAQLRHKMKDAIQEAHDLNLARSDELCDSIARSLTDSLLAPVAEKAREGATATADASRKAASKAQEAFSAASASDESATEAAIAMAHSRAVQQAVALAEEGVGEAATSQLSSAWEEYVSAYSRGAKGPAFHRALLESGIPGLLKVAEQITQAREQAVSSRRDVWRAALEVEGRYARMAAAAADEARSQASEASEQAAIARAEASKQQMAAEASKIEAERWRTKAIEAESARDIAESEARVAERRQLSAEESAEAAKRQAETARVLASSAEEAKRLATSEADAARAEIAALKQRVEIAESKSQRLDLTVKGRETRIEGLEKDMDIAQTRLRESKKECVTLTERVRSLEAEADRLRSTHQSELLSARNASRSVESETLKMRREIEELHAAVEAAKAAASEEVKAREATETACADALEEAEHEKDSFEKERNAAREERDHLDEELGAVRGRLSLVEGELSTARERLSDADERARAMELEAEQLRSEVEELTRASQGEASNLKTANDRADSLERETAALRAELDAMAEHANEQEQKLSEWTELGQSLERELASLREAAQSTAEEHERAVEVALKRAVDSHKEELSQAERLNQQLSDEMEALRGELEIAHATYSDKIERLETELASFREKESQWLELRQGLEGEVSERKAQLLSMANEMDQLKSDVESLTSRLEAEESSHDADLGQLAEARKQSQTFKDQLGASRKLCTSFESKMKELEEQLARQRVDQEESLESSASKRCTLEGESRSLRAQLSEAAVTISRLEASLSASEQKLSSTLQERAELETEAESSVREATASIERLVNQVRGLEQEKLGLSDKVRGLDSRLADATERLGKSEARTAELREEVSRALESLRASERARDEAAQDYRAHQGSMDELRSSLDEQRSRAGRAEAKVESLGDQLKKMRQDVDESESKVLVHRRALKSEEARSATIHGQLLRALAQAAELQARVTALGSHAMSSEEEEEFARLRASARTSRLRRQRLVDAVASIFALMGGMCVSKHDGKRAKVQRSRVLRLVASQRQGKLSPAETCPTLGDSASAVSRSSRSGYLSASLDQRSRALASDTAATKPQWRLVWYDMPPGEVPAFHTKSSIGGNPPSGGGEVSGTAHGVWLGQIRGVSIGSDLSAGFLHSPERPKDASACVSVWTEERSFDFECGSRADAVTAVFALRSLLWASQGTPLGDVSRVVLKMEAAGVFLRASVAAKVGPDSRAVDAAMRMILLQEKADARLKEEPRMFRECLAKWSRMRSRRLEIARDYERAVATVNRQIEPEPTDHEEVKEEHEDGSESPVAVEPVAQEDRSSRFSRGAKAPGNPFAPETVADEDDSEAESPVAVEPVAQEDRSSRFSRGAKAPGNPFAPETVADEDDSEAESPVAVEPVAQEDRSSRFSRGAKAPGNPFAPETVADEDDAESPVAVEPVAQEDRSSRFSRGAKAPGNPFAPEIVADEDDSESPVAVEPVAQEDRSSRFSRGVKVASPSSAPPPPPMRTVNGSRPHITKAPPAPVDDEADSESSDEWQASVQRPSNGLESKLSSNRILIRTEAVTPSRQDRFSRPSQAADLETLSTRTETGSRASSHAPRRVENATGSSSTNWHRERMASDAGAAAVLGGNPGTSDAYDEDEADSEAGVEDEADSQVESDEESGSHRAAPPPAPSSTPGKASNLLDDPLMGFDPSMLGSAPQHSARRRRR